MEKPTAVARITFYVSLLFFMVLIPCVRGDGMFVWNKGADLYEPSQKAIIHWADGKETLILQVKYEGAAEDFGWIVPLPAEPEVTAIDADKSPFAELSLYAQIRERIGFRGKGMDDTPENDVTVLQRKAVGVYDVAVLASSDANALNKWLSKNGFFFPKDKSDILEYYTRKNWVYVAMKIEPKALESDDVKKLKTGELQPIRFSFASDEMVYPLKVSSANAGETELLLYLLADTPMVLENDNPPEGFSIERNLVSDVSYLTINHIDLQYGTFCKAEQKYLPLTWEALGVPDETKLSLCKYKAVYTPEKMTEDLVFTPFSPLNYWAKHFFLEIDDDYQDEHDRQRACAVFGYYDPALLEKLAKSPYKENRVLAALHPKTPDDLLTKLARDSEYDVRLNLLWNTQLPLQVLEILAKDPGENRNKHDEILRSLVAGHPQATLEILEGLLDDPDPGIRWSLARRKDMPADWLEKLSKDENESVRMAVVQNPEVSFDLLNTFLTDKNSDIRRYVIFHPKVTLSMLKKLLEDTDSGVRQSLAYKEGIPAEWLVKLSKDRDPRVRAAVAENPDISPVILPVLLEGLVVDKSPGVRSRVMGHPKATLKILEKGLSDPEPSVRWLLARREDIPSDWLKKLSEDENRDVRMAVAKNAGAPVEVLSVLAKDEDSYVRNSVMFHPKATLEILEIFIEDSDSDIRVRLMYLEKFPTEWLFKLAKDKIPQIRSAVARHPKTPIALLGELVNDESWGVRCSVIQNPEVTVEILEKLLDDSDAQVRLKLAYRKDIPTEWLVKLSKDQSPQVRAAVATRRDLSEAIKEELARDPSEKVRKAFWTWKKSRN